MRAYLILPVLLLAACGQAPETPQQTRRELSPAPAPEPVPLENNASAMNEMAAPADVLPKALQGRWTDQKDDCADPASDMQLTVTPRQLLFHESAGTVLSVAPLPGGGARVAAHFTGEGESWNRTLTLTPSADGQLITVVGDGVSVARKRCPR